METVISVELEFLESKSYEKPSFQNYSGMNKSLPFIYNFIFVMVLHIISYRWWSVLLVLTLNYWIVPYQFGIPDIYN